MVLFKIKNANDVLEFIANHIFQKLVNFTYLDFRDLQIYQYFQTEASNKKTMKDSDFTITTAEGESQIKTFPEVINSFSNHLQFIIKTISTFRELHKKSQQQFDNQAKTYLTCNYFQMKLISSKEYLQAQKELKQILQKIIKVQQQAQDGKHTQKTLQNQIILQLTQNIKNCSDLLKKSKNIIGLAKSRNDIEFESMKNCNQYLDQLKESLNVCVKNLEKFVQRNQMNLQINQIGKVQNQANKLSKQSVNQINQNNEAENKVQDQSKKGNQQLQLVTQQLKLQKQTANQLKQTVTVIEEQLKSMITKTKQSWLYKHFQMEVKEEKKKKKQFEQKNYLAIKQGSVKQLQMVNMIDQMNEYIVSLTGSTYSELLTVNIQLLKMEMKNNNQPPQKYNVIYLQEVKKLIDKMNNESYRQQKELKQMIQQLIDCKMQDSCKKKIAELEAKYKTEIQNIIKIKDKQIQELNQQLQEISSSLKAESQKLKTLNAELDNKKEQICQIQSNNLKNSFELNKKFKQEQEKLEGSIKQKQQKIRDLQNKLQNQKSKLKTTQKQHQMLKNNNNDTINNLQATLQQNEKLKRLFQDNKREMNIIKNSVAFKESELSKFKQQLNKTNSSIQSLQQQIFGNQVTIAELNQQLSTKNQQITNLTNSINLIKSQSNKKITSLTQKLSAFTSQLQSNESNLDQQKQFKTVDFPEANHQIQKLQQQLKKCLQISDIHKQEQQTNQNNIKSLTQTNQSNTQIIHLLQNEITSLKKEIQSLQQNNTQMSTQNNQNKQLIAQLTTLEEENLQSNHLSTLLQYQKGKNQANKEQITELKESIKTLAEQNTKHQLENLKMKIQIQNLEKEEKQLKQNLKNKENEIQVNSIDFNNKQSKQQKHNAQNSVKINALIDQVNQQKTMIEVRDSQIKGLKENCKLMGNHIITLQKVYKQKEKLDVHVIELNKKIKYLQQQCDNDNGATTQVNQSNSQLQTKLCAKIQRLKGREIQMKDSFEIQKSQFRKCVQELKTQISQKDDKIKTLSAKILSEEDEIGKLQKQVQSSKSNEADLLSQLQKIKSQSQALSLQKIKFKQGLNIKNTYIQDVQDQLSAAKIRITRLESRLKNISLNVNQIFQVGQNQRQQKTIQ